MKNTLTLLACIGMLAFVTGCSAVRGAIETVSSAGGSVKRVLIGSIDVAENLATNAVAGLQKPITPVVSSQ